MAFINLPPALQDIFNKINDRVAKLESGPSQAMYTAVTAQGTAASAQAIAESAVVDAVNAEAAAAQALAQSSQAIQKSVNTITNASNQLTAMNASGITVYSGASASTGARVLMNSLGIVAYNSSNVATLTIDASNGSISMLGALTSGSTVSGATITGGVIQTSTGNDAVVLLGASNAIGVKSGGAYVGFIESIGSGAMVMHYGSTPSVNTYPQYRASSLAATVTGTASSGFSANSDGTNGVTGSTTFLANAIFSNYIYNPGYQVSTSGGAARINDATTPTARLVAASGSSERFKQDIVSIETVPDLDPAKLLNLEVKAFRFKDDYLDKEDERSGVLVPGFIAEQLDAIYPVAVDHDKQGLASRWSADFIIPGMLSLIQKLEKRITELEGK
jgi:hypothetical protein